MGVFNSNARHQNNRIALEGNSGGGGGAGGSGGARGSEETHWLLLLLLQKHLNISTAGLVMASTQVAREALLATPFWPQSFRTVASCPEESSRRSEACQKPTATAGKLPGPPPRRGRTAQVRRPPLAGGEKACETFGCPPPPFPLPGGPKSD